MFSNEDLVKNLPNVNQWYNASYRIFGAQNTEFLVRVSFRSRAPPFFHFWEGKGREGKEREGKGMEGKEREGKGRKGKGMEGKESNLHQNTLKLVQTFIRDGR